MVVDFPAPFGPEKSEYLIVIYCKADPVYSAVSAVVLGQIFYCDHELLLPVCYNIV